MEKYRSRKKIEDLLVSLGISPDEEVYWAAVLSKYDSFNYCPDCELRQYLKLFRRFLDDKHERWHSGHSYAACFYMWQNLAKIWTWRKSLSREERWALKG